MLRITKFVLPPLMGTAALVTTLSQHLDPLSSITLSASWAYTAWSLLGWAADDENA